MDLCQNNRIWPITQPNQSTTSNINVGKLDISYRRNKTCHCIHCPVPEKWCGPKSSTDSWNSKDLMSTCHLWQIPENIVYFTSQSKFPSLCHLCVYIHAVYKIYKLQNSKYDNMHGGFVDRYAMIWIVEYKTYKRYTSFFPIPLPKSMLTILL